jgi:membrane-associated phospholipid phosphatase
MSDKWKSILVYGGTCLVVCSVLYLGSNYLSESLEHHYHLFFEFEKDIPLVPWMIVVYASLYLLIPSGYLLAKGPEVIKRISLSLMLSAIIAAIIFVVFPGELGFERGEVLGVFGGVFEVLYLMDKPYNLYPSLHIAFSGIITLFVISQGQTRLVSSLFLLWFLLICCSVVLVHQHHLFDVFTGAILGWGCWMWGTVRSS